MSQAAISVAELAEEAARRSLENSRIYEDRESRSRPGSTRSLSIDWKKENRRLRSEAKETRALNLNPSLNLVRLMMKNGRALILILI